MQVEDGGEVGAEEMEREEEDVEGRQHELVLVDWGTAIPVQGSPRVFEGGLKYASRRVLQHLSQPGGLTTPIAFLPADDLASIVRSLFALKHRLFKQKLDALAGDDAQHVACGALELWDQWLSSSSRPGWRAAEEQAEACAYDAVADALDALME